uniref:Uncharacterized protein n=1 Tax=Anguilla anguilla TaxID=7936 RepID=A0A0E9RCD4_ANGAN
MWLIYWQNGFPTNTKSSCGGKRKVFAADWTTNLIFKMNHLSCVSECVSFSSLCKTIETST